MTITKKQALFLAFMMMAMLALIKAQKSRADFYESFIAKESHNETCSEKAMLSTKADFKPEWTISEKMAYAYTSTNYRICMGLPAKMTVAQQ